MATVSAAGPEEGSLQFLHKGQQTQGLSLLRMRNTHTAMGQRKQTNCQDEMVKYSMSVHWLEIEDLKSRRK